MASTKAHRVGDATVTNIPELAIEAQYLFSGRERAYLAALSVADGSDAAIRAETKLGSMPHPPQSGVYEGVYEDSALPVIDAGLDREIVVDGTEVAEGISILPIPGHSIDHACIRFSSPGRTGAFVGRRDAPSAAGRQARL
jgi:glyoxylase-like metal-dependent hydrolase (beta-lactamase superfamily II)